MVVDRQTSRLEEHHFFDLPTLLTANDVLVRNNTKVLPARIVGHKDTGGQVELLLTKRVGVNGVAQTETWECLTKPGLKTGQKVTFEVPEKDSPLTATCEAITEMTRQIVFNLAGDALLTELYRIGQTPLPPYIAWQIEDELELRQLYQTTYAKHLGSAAAPTAGLHFTPELDAKLITKGVQIEEVTLHVGLGTFLPVKSDTPSEHHMHSEWFELTAAVADRLNQAKKAGKRIIAVGTTTCRVLESAVSETEVITPHNPTKIAQVVPQQRETAIFIYPPYQFRFIDGLITNFHLPKSSLLLLISAFTSQPNTPHPFTTFTESSVGQAYQKAIAEGYRFYSFGDAMLIK